MTCKDCVHYNVCKYEYERTAEDCFCGAYKCKYSYKEIVHCCECKFCKAIKDSEGNGIPYCDRTFAKPDVDPTDYCSYGERRDT